MEKGRDADQQDLGLLLEMILLRWYSVWLAGTRLLILYLTCHKMVLGLSVFTPRTWVVEAGGPGVQGHPWLYWEFKDSWDYMETYPREKKKGRCRKSARGMREMFAKIGHFLRDADLCRLPESSRLFRKHNRFIPFVMNWKIQCSNIFT